MFRMYARVTEHFVCIGLLGSDIYSITSWQYDIECLIYIRGSIVDTFKRRSDSSSLHSLGVH